LVGGVSDSMDKYLLFSRDLNNIGAWIGLGRGVLIVLLAPWIKHFRQKWKQDNVGESSDTFAARRCRSYNSGMANYLNDDAICLRVTDFSETSQIVALLTREHGMLPLIAKGSKRQTKKGAMSGPLDLLTRGEVVFIPAKGAAELGTLTAWELVNHRTALRADFAALNAAMVAAEMTLHLLHPHDPHAGVFDELDAALELFPTPQRPRALVAYAKAVLEETGYGPQFDACVACGKGVTADVPLKFNAQAGGITCAECHTQGTATATTGKIAIALSRLPRPTVLLAQAGEMAGRPADPAALLTALQLLLEQVESVSGKGLKTRYLLGSIFGVPVGERSSNV
jgi:DNA repair protein RecO (recombination protein O)